MDWRRQLLWLDGSGGLIVGAIVLLLSGWLSELHQLPRSVVVFMAIANLAYGTYSTSLALRSERPLKLILILVAANLTWSVVCIILVTYHRDTISVFGLIHVMGEGIYVAGLAWFEYRWRDLLQQA